VLSLFRDISESTMLSPFSPVIQILKIFKWIGGFHLTFDHHNEEILSTPKHKKLRFLFLFLFYVILVVGQFTGESHLKDKFYKIFKLTLFFSPFLSNPYHGE